MKKGLLTKRPNKDDGRSVLIRLTSQGQQAIARVAPLLRRNNELFFQHVTKDDLGAVRRFLFKLIRNSEYALAEIRQAALTQPEQ